MPDPDPPAPLPTPVPWLNALATALARSRNDPAAHFAQLATRGLDGAPRCRTVVIRAIVEAEGAMLFCTDARSPKLEQIAADPRAELCWYFADAREQFRFAGEIALSGAGDTSPAWRSREALWDYLPEATRASFAGPPPGALRAAAPPSAARLDANGAPDTFVTAALFVRTVDHLRLREAPHGRTLHQRGDGGLWTRVELWA